MRKIPQISLLSLFVFVGLNLFAQTSTVIKSDNNGKLNYSYTYTSTSNNSYNIQIVFKNDQFIYKQEIDTLQITSSEAFTLLKQDLQNALTALQNANSNFKITRSNYTFSYNDTGVSGVFIVLTNKAGNITTANSRFQIKVLLEWLNTIEFGKS
jgi:hypothetical protein